MDAEYYNQQVINAIDVEADIERFEQTFSDLDVPNDPGTVATYNLFCYAISNAKTDPKSAFAGDCIVCRKQHNFDDCPTLKNHEFLKKHYIQFCQLLRKHQRNLNESASDSGKKKAAVNYVRDRSIRFSDDNGEKDSQYETEATARDFQRGTRW